MKKQNFTVVVTCFVIFIVILFLFKSIYYDQKIDKEIRLIKASLISSRSTIKEFFDSKGDYPADLDELKEYLSRNNKWSGIEVLRKSLLFNGKILREVSVMDGDGGLYYNNKEGILKINLDQPVSDYIDDYCGAFRNDIPSDW